jgi:hypothetical protein
VSVCSLFRVFWSVAGCHYANRRKVLEIAFHKGIGQFPVLCFHFLLFQINACKSYCLQFSRILAIVYHIQHHSGDSIFVQCFLSSKQRTEKTQKLNVTAKNVT